MHRSILASSGSALREDAADPHILPQTRSEEKTSSYMLAVTFRQLCRMTHFSTYKITISPQHLDILNLSYISLYEFHSYNAVQFK